MIALVSKTEIKKYVQQFPDYADCPPYVFITVLPVLDEEAAKRLEVALKRKATRQTNEEAPGNEEKREPLGTNSRHFCFMQAAVLGNRSGSRVRAHFFSAGWVRTRTYTSSAWDAISASSADMAALERRSGCRAPFSHSFTIIIAKYFCTVGRSLSKPFSSR
jgi:hypothetical protein